MSRRPKVDFESVVKDIEGGLREGSVILPDRPVPTEQFVHVVGDGNSVYVAGRDLHMSDQERPSSGAEGVRRFTNVWYLPKRLRFYQPVNADVGTLVIDGDRVEFRGEKSSLSIGDIHDVAHTRHGGDISNSWVRVTYGDPSAPSEAYFSHRTRLGLDALLGGSEDLFAVLHHRMRPGPAG